MFTPCYHLVEVKIERNIGENLSYKKCFARFARALNRGRCVRASIIAQ